ncbi:MAG TPA: TIGR00730 family Rossman fold protein [Candidatus Binatia bacterium]|nr:TIGR00730 family Rossman fold protein [Candidatus Binatia bacterium]
MEQPKVILDNIEAQVAAWLHERSSSGNEALIGEMIRTLVKLAADGTSRGDLKILNRTLKELRNAFRVFAPYKDVRKVSIFGSTHIKESDPYYHLTRDLAQRLVQEGLMVITGAGPGIMQAGHEGAGPERSFGVNIRLPAVQQANRFIKDDSKLMSFHFFFTRKLMFVKEADAVVIFPGGFGTHDELYESLTLAQTGKSQIVPIILMDLPGEAYWKAWERFVREAMLSRRYISGNEFSFFKIMDNIDAAIGEIKTFYRNFHSYRFVRHDLVIRLNHPPAPALIDTLNQTFPDILKGGKILRTDPPAEEADDPSALHLPRLRVPFNREDFARLRQMIDVINREG